VVVDGCRDRRFGLEGDARPAGVGASDGIGEGTLDESFGATRPVGSRPVSQTHHDVSSPAATPPSGARATRPPRRCTAPVDVFPYGEWPTQCGSLTLLEVPDDLAPYYPRHVPEHEPSTPRRSERPPSPRITAVRVVDHALPRGSAATPPSGCCPTVGARTLAIILESVAPCTWTAAPPGARRRFGFGDGAARGVARRRGSEGLGHRPVRAGRPSPRPARRTADEDARAGRRLRSTSSCSTTRWSTCPTRSTRLQQVRRLLTAPRALRSSGLPTASSLAWREYGHRVDPARPAASRVGSRRGPGLQRASPVAPTSRWSAPTTTQGPFQFWGSEQARRGIPLMDPRVVLRRRQARRGSRGRTCRGTRTAAASSTVGPTVTRRWSTSAAD